MSKIEEQAARADQAMSRMEMNIQTMENLILEFGLALAREQDRREKAEQKVIRLAAALRKIEHSLTALWIEDHPAELPDVCAYAAGIAIAALKEETGDHHP